jgi:hypothetical protein
LQLHENKETTQILGWGRGTHAIAFASERKSSKHIYIPAEFTDVSEKHFACIFMVEE